MDLLSIFYEISYTSIAISFSALFLCYWYSVRSHDYWKKRGIPFVKPYPVIGSILDSFKKPIHDIEVERYRKYGSIYGQFEGSVPVLSVADPELLKLILVKDFHVFQGNRFSSSSGSKIMDRMLSVVKGEDWRRIRTIVSPTFSTRKMKKLMSIFNDCCQTLLTNFKSSEMKKEPIDAKKVFGAFTLDVIASSAFSTKLDSFQNPNNKFVQMARELLPSGLSLRLVTFLMIPKIMKFFGESFFSSKCMNYFAVLTHQIIDERKRTGQTRNDFLQLLLDISKEFEEGKFGDFVEEADDVTANYGSKEEVIQPLDRILLNKSLSADEVVSQCVQFFLAGYESTSTTLAISTYLLAIHPHIQEKVQQEIDSVLQETNGEMTYEAVQKMKYLDNVISETLRLYPPAGRTERVAEVDYQLGNTGITIEKGTIVTIPVVALHRDPNFFPDPDKFDPDRFLPEEKSKRETFAYMPFGGGPRICVAMRFALLEIKVCLAHIVKNFELKKCSLTRIPLEFPPGQVLLQPNGMFFQLKFRN